MWLIILTAGWITAQAQYQQEVPGDNFSLEGALELFKESETPKEFERKLNDPDTRVNNLDLNNNGYIDYIRVIDLYEGNVHAFVLQAVISKKEFQDVAVITLEKRANGRAVLQITGDADIYGVETIIEPTTEVRTYAGTTRSRAIVNVWAWPMVRYVYSPYYSVWVSPWDWGYHPHWWRPWRPVYYYDYYTYWRPYRSHYSICYTHRVVYAHHIYAPHRTTSVIVRKHYNPTIVKYRTRYINKDGSYRHRGDDRSYSRRSSTVRYDANGKISSRTNRSDSKKVYTNSRNQSRISGSDQRSATIQNRDRSLGRSSRDGQVTNDRIQGRSSGARSSNELNRGSINDKSNSYRGRDQSFSSKGNSGTSVNKNNARSFSRSSGSKQQTSSAPKVQRSYESSKSNSNIRRSTGSSNAKSYSGRSSSVNRSSGNSSIQRSSGRSSAVKSSGSSKVQRSSSGSNSSKSSGRSSSSSNSGRSSSSKSSSRSRH